MQQNLWKLTLNASGLEIQAQRGTVQRGLLQVGMNLFQQDNIILKRCIGSAIEWSDSFIRDSARLDRCADNGCCQNTADIALRTDVPIFRVVRLEIAFNLFVESRSHRCSRACVRSSRGNPEKRFCVLNFDLRLSATVRTDERDRSDTAACR